MNSQSVRIPKYFSIMPLENMTDMLAKALAGKYAVGAFNILDCAKVNVSTQLSEVEVADWEKVPK